MAKRVGVDSSGFGIYGEVDRDETTILCHECGERLSWLPNHLKHAHNMTSAEYRDKHGLARKQPLSSIALQRSRSTAAKEHEGSDGWTRFQEAGEQVREQIHEKLRAGELKPRISPAGLENARKARAQSDLIGTERARFWRASADAYVAFLRAGSPPPRRRSSDAEERHLGDWMYRNRMQLRAGKLDVERASWLNEHLPGWEDGRTFAPPA